MKKIFVLIIFSCISLPVFSQATLQPQDAAIDTSWKKGGLFAVSFNQVSLTNWAAGGENTMSGASFLSIFANYAKDRMAWDNALDLGYGITKIGDADIRKNEDKIDITSKIGYSTAPGSKFFYTFLVNFKSQFAEGFNYAADPEGEHAISKFLAPGYLLYSLGIDYKPNDALSIYLSPATGKTIIVNDDSLAAIGAYGVEDGKKTLTQVGALFRLTYKKDVVENVNLQTKAEFFSNYLKNPQNISINWDVLIAMKVNKFLSANIGTTLIYDDIIPVPIVKDQNGIKTVVGTGPRVQFKEIFGIGLSYKF